MGQAIPVSYEQAKDPQPILVYTITDLASCKAAIKEMKKLGICPKQIFVDIKTYWRITNENYPKNFVDDVAVLWK